MCLSVGICGESKESLRFAEGLSAAALNGLRPCALIAAVL
jgi:hypothetical protein